MRTNNVAGWEFGFVRVKDSGRYLLIIIVIVSMVVVDVVVVVLQIAKNHASAGRVDLGRALPHWVISYLSMRTVS